MDKDQFLEMVNLIGTTEDETERREKLAQLKEDITSVFDNNSSLSDENNKYKEENEKLRSANMELFLRVGSNKSPEEIKKDQVGEVEETPEPRKFKDLFDDKGGLK